MAVAVVGRAGRGISVCLREASVDGLGADNSDRLVSRR